MHTQCSENKQTVSVKVKFYCIYIISNGVCTCVLFGPSCTCISRETSKDTQKKQKWDTWTLWIWSTVCVQELQQYGISATIPRRSVCSVFALPNLLRYHRGVFACYHTTEECLLCLTCYHTTEECLLCLTCYVTTEECLLCLTCYDTTEECLLCLTCYDTTEECLQIT